MLDAALALAARGFRVIPLYDPGPKGKRPRIDDWATKASTLPGQISGWWSVWPNANIGAAMGGPERVIAIDIDGAKGGFESWHATPWDGATLQSNSGSGNGCHLLFRLQPHHDLARIRNAIEFRPGLDVRAEGGQVVLPPSLHESGKIYQWVSLDVPIAPLPDWLYALIERDPAAAVTGPDTHTPREHPPLLERIERARAAVLALPPAVSGQGGHNRLLVAATVAYRGFDLSRGAAEYVLEDYNRRCEPPWSPAELAHKLSAVEVNARDDWGYILRAEEIASAFASEAPPKSAETVAGAIKWLHGDTAAEPLAEPNWVVKDLQICPGRPTLIAGYGASGKTLIAQALLLAFASNHPIWNHYTAGGAGGRVVRHFDHEQGTYATLRRYQRLAKGLGVNLADLGTSFGVACFPDIGLDLPNARDAYAKACAGANLVLIDALRGAAPSEDENDSKIRRCIDHLGWVSEQIGCAFILIHHAGKTKGDDKRTGPRGSSAIFDGCGSVFQISAEDLDAPKDIHQTKPAAEAETGIMAPFQVSIEDEIGSGLVVRHQTFTPQTANEVLAAKRAEILAYVDANPGASQLGVKSTVKGKGETVGDLIKEMLHANPWQLVNRKSNPGPGVPMALFTRNNDPGNWV